MSEDRLGLGVILKQSIADNIVLAVLKDLRGRFGLIPRFTRRRLAADWVQRLAIKVPSADRPVGTLSGGNQQRVVLAKWLAAHPKVLILDSPTVGVDIKNKAGIYAVVAELAREGVGVIVISDEVLEIFATCDRVLHMRAGRIVEEAVPGADHRTGAGGADLCVIASPALQRRPEAWLLAVILVIGAGFARRGPGLPEPRQSRRPARDLFGPGHHGDGPLRRAGLGRHRHLLRRHGLGGAIRRACSARPGPACRPALSPRASASPSAPRSAASMPR